MKTKQLFIPIILSVLLAATQSLDGQTTTQSKSFKVNKGGTLEVSVRAGDIRLGTWDKNEVFVKAREIEEEDLDDLEMTQTGNTVRVEFDSRWGSTPEFDISLPTQFNVDAQTSGGDISVRGSITGLLSGKTSGGDIKIGDVVGTVDMNTSGGDITTGDVQGDLYLNTSGGDVHVRFVSGKAGVNTSGGDIRVEKVGKTLRANTSGGDIVVGDIGGEATVSSSGGDVIVGRVSGGASLGTAGGNLSLRSATGRVIAKTAGGDIELDSVAGSVDARTASGSIDAEWIPTGKGKSRLSTAAGDITLYVPENAKATIVAQVRMRGWWKDEEEESNIYSDFKANTFEKNEREREIQATYTLNGGGDTITLETALGSIEIRKLDSHMRQHDHEYRYERKRDKRRSTGGE